MKKTILLLLLTSATTLLCYGADASLEKFIIGKWKIAGIKWSPDEATLPAAYSIVGEHIINADGTFTGWIQTQGDPSGKITFSSGTWKLNNNNILSTLSSSPKDRTPIEMRVRRESDLLVFEQISDTDPLILFMKRMEKGLSKNEIEGLKVDYKISVPEHWNVITPESCEKLPSKERSSFERLYLRALAISPNNDANISINVTGREVSIDEADIKWDTSSQDLGVKTKKINSTEWKIRNIRFNQGLLHSYGALSYHDGKTLRLTFSFNKSYPNKEAIVHEVLESFSILKTPTHLSCKIKGDFSCPKCNKPVRLLVTDPDGTRSYISLSKQDPLRPNLSICPYCNYPLNKSRTNRSTLR